MPATFACVQPRLCTCAYRECVAVRMHIFHSQKNSIQFSHESDSDTQCKISIHSSFNRYVWCEINGDRKKLINPNSQTHIEHFLLRTVAFCWLLPLLISFKRPFFASIWWPYLDLILTCPVRAGNGATVYLSVVVANLISICHGIAIGWLSPNIQKLRTSESPLTSGPLTLGQMSWLGSSFSLGAVIGNCLFGVLSTYIGRKHTLCILAVPNLVSDSLL